MFIAMLAVTFTVNLMVLAAEMGGVSLALQFLTDGASSGRPFRSPSSWALQAGVDGTLHENEAGTLTGGITFHADSASAEVSSRFGNGNIDTTGYGLDGTLTWYGKSGFYRDTQTALTWYDSDLKSSALNDTLASGNDGLGYGLSIEVVQKIALTRQCR